MLNMYFEGLIRFKFLLNYLLRFVKQYLPFELDLQQEYEGFISLLQHRDTPADNPDIKFEFTQENLKVCVKQNKIGTKGDFIKPQQLLHSYFGNIFYFKIIRMVHNSTKIILIYFYA